MFFTSEVIFLSSDKFMMTIFENNSNRLSHTKLLTRLILYRSSMGVKHSWYEIYLEYTERYLDITLNILGVDEEAEEGESKE